MTNGPIVTTLYGDILGHPSDNGIISFKGIPYAAPPIGANRFQPPQQPEKWSDVRNATGYGATCHQVSGDDDPLALLPNVIIPGDDYLNLNVWTSSLIGRRPVMVFIHGGSFKTGSGAEPLYDGTNFARDGVVLVTINYRLGADGFLWFGEGVPNLGLLDQIAALIWVRDNIEGFGGDPGNVTIFGESAGAMSVCTLMAMPTAKGLFRRAIAQSGAAQSTIDRSTALKIGTKLAAMLGVEPSRKAISEVPIDRLVEAQNVISADLLAAPRPELWGDAASTMLAFSPVVDGEILPDRPINSISQGSAQGVDLLIGSNSEEANLIFVPSGLADRITDAMIDVMTRAYGLPTPQARELYRANRQGATPGEIFCSIFTDWLHRIPVLRVAEAHPGTHVYEFSWRSPAFDNKLGACHAAELSFVFDNVKASGIQNLNGDNPPQELADRMHKTWVNFATTGNLGWPAYTPENRCSMTFGDMSAVTTDDRSTERVLWSGVR